MNWQAKRDGFLAGMSLGPQIMGILNVTPDSFSDGGMHNALHKALDHANRMIAEGADILDVGGESTRPGATPVPAADELARVLPVVESLAQQHVPVSIDTYKASVARACIKAGAVMINDVWGLQKDDGMAEVAADTGALLVMMHNRQSTDPDIDILDDMRRFLDRSLSIAAKAGVPTQHQLVDPGIGFGKTPKQSLLCLQNLDLLYEWYGLPVLLGLSRKRFIGHVLGNDVNDRLIGTLAANMIGLAKGAAVLRVHDVEAHSQAVRIFAAAKGTV